LSEVDQSASDNLDLEERQPDAAMFANLGDFAHSTRQEA
jgi:hypothetical protein